MGVVTLTMAHAVCCLSPAWCLESFGWEGGGLGEDRPQPQAHEMNQDWFKPAMVMAAMVLAGTFSDVVRGSILFPDKKTEPPLGEAHVTFSRLDLWYDPRRHSSHLATARQ